MDRTEALLQYIKKEILHGRAINLGLEDDLLGAGIIDSLGILQLVTFVEKQFGIRVPDEDVVYENFNSIKAMVTYLSKY